MLDVPMVADGSTVVIAPTPSVRELQGEADKAAVARQIDRVQRRMFDVIDGCGSLGDLMRVREFTRDLLARVLGQMGVTDAE